MALERYYYRLALVLRKTEVFFFPVCRSASRANEQKSNLIYIMNILRPLSTHLARIFKRWSIPFLALATIVLVFYVVCLKLGILPYFSLVMLKGGFILGGRALSFLLIKLGCNLLYFKLKAV